MTHTFEIESIKRFEDIERRMHYLLGYAPEKKQKAIDKEVERRNVKLSPLGMMDSKGVITLSFKWKDLRSIPNT